MRVALIALLACAAAGAVMLFPLGSGEELTGIELTGTPQQSREVMSHLESGRNVEIRTIARWKDDRLEHVWSTMIDSLGKVRPKTRNRMVTQYHKSIADSTRRVFDTGWPGVDEDRVVRLESGELYKIEKLKAAIDVLNRGSAFYTTCSSLPRIEGWEFALAFNKRVAFDTETGKAVRSPDLGRPKDVKEFSRKVGSGRVKFRDLNVMIPINLSEYPSVATSRQYMEDAAGILSDERRHSFNMKPLVERQRLYAARLIAIRELESIDRLKAEGKWPANKAARDRELELHKARSACYFDVFDREKCIALPPRKGGK
jgi:hypothetical protein